MFRRILPSFSARFLSTAETQAAKAKAVKVPKVAATPDVDAADVEDSSNVNFYHLSPLQTVIMDLLCAYSVF